jgi:hypothetical protein
VHGVEYVEIVQDRRLVALGLMQDDCLDPRLQARSRRRANVAPRECGHPHTSHAFAYRRSRDEHWPVSYCDECLTVLAGRDPLVKAGRRPRWKYDERNVTAARWAREWPKGGRPRRRIPPSEIAWPDAA